MLKVLLLHIAKILLLFGYLIRPGRL